MTVDDKIHIMGEIIKKMDVDGDDKIETSELATWIHYVEQTRYDYILQANGYLLTILDFILMCLNNFLNSMLIKTNL